MLLAACLATTPAPVSAGEIVYATRDAGGCALRARTRDFPPGVAERRVALTAACRYRKEDDRWVPLALPPSADSVVRAERGPLPSGPVPPDPVLFDLSAILALGDDPALLAVEWREDGVRARALVPCGGFLCQDLHLGPSPAGRLAACLPGRRSAEARFVPDPELDCYAAFDVPDTPTPAPRRARERPSGS